MTSTPITPDLFKDVRSEESVKAVESVSALLANMVAELRDTVPEHEFNIWKEKFADAVEFLGFIYPLVAPEVKEEKVEETSKDIDKKPEVESAEEPEVEPEDAVTKLKRRLSPAARKRLEASNSEDAVTKLKSRLSPSARKRLEASHQRETSEPQVVNIESVDRACLSPELSIPVGVELDIDIHEKDIEAVSRYPQASDYEKALVLAHMWKRDEE